MTTMTKESRPTIQVLPSTHRKIKTVSSSLRIPIIQFIDVAVVAWDLLTPEQQVQAIRRPSPVPSRRSKPAPAPA